MPPTSAARWTTVSGAPSAKARATAVGVGQVVLRPGAGRRLGRAGGLEPLAHAGAEEPGAAGEHDALAADALGHRGPSLEAPAATLGTWTSTCSTRTLADQGEPAFRSRQVWEWMARGAGSYEEMTNLPAALRDQLAERVPFSSLAVEREALASDGTEKALFHTGDGRPIEAVLMRYRDGRRSLCLSSQSGCPLTCTFCATGTMKFGRNLTASEILDQALHFRRKEAVDHCVFMGMGEPLLNLDNVLGRLRAPARHRHPPHLDHDLHRGLDPRHRAPDRARGADDPAGALAARPRRRPALGADAGQRALSAGRRAGRVPRAGTRRAGARCTSST